MTRKKQMLRDGVDAMLGGGWAAAQGQFRDYVKAEVGYRELARFTKIPAKSLIRMFGPKGNPRAKNLFAALDCLQRWEGVRLRVKTTSLKSK